MTYRPRDDVDYGGEHGGPVDQDLTSDAADGTGELPSRRRRGAHSNDRLGTDTGLHRYVYERPADAPTRSRSRHAAPGDDEAAAVADTSAAVTAPAPSTSPPSGSSWTSSAATRDSAPADGRDHTAAQTFSWREPATDGGSGAASWNYRDSAYDEYDRSARGDAVGIDRGYPESGPRWGMARGGEPSAWDERALQAAAGFPYRAGNDDNPNSSPGTGRDSSPGTGRISRDETASPALMGGGTLTATRPLHTAHAPYPSQRLSPDVDTEVVPAVVEDPAEAEVPLAPPTTGGRLRFLGKKHVGLRLAAVSVLVLGSAIGVAVGVLRDTNSDTVKVTDDIQADAANSAAPTSDANNASPTQAAPVGAEQTVKQRQQAVLVAAKKLAASKAAAAQTAAAATARKAALSRASRSESRDTESGSTGDPVPSTPVDCKTYSGNRATGCTLLAEFSFSTSQMDCLDKLWTRESQWTTTAENTSSGAYGIPQSLPGDKMASVADDWKTNPATQIRWGLGYIKGRYGTPCSAWAHSEAYNNY